MPIEQGAAGPTPAPHLVRETEEEQIREQDHSPLLENVQNRLSPASNTDSSTFSRRTWTALAPLWRAFAWRASETSEEDASGTRAQIESNSYGLSNASQGAESASQVLSLVRSNSSQATIPVEQAPSSEIEGMPASSGIRNTSTAPICLICLETLASDDFASGRAISLGCECRGDLALRHRDCAVKWAQIKDDGRGGVPVCELCKQPVRNLPPLPPRPHQEVEAAAALSAGEVYSDPSAFASFAPSTADLVFDCIRVTWVAMIVSILFFEASLGSALSTGLVAGVAYSLMVRIMYRQHFEAMRAYAQEHAAARQQFDPSGGQIPVQVV